MATTTLRARPSATVGASRALADPAPRAPHERGCTEALEASIAGVPHELDVAVRLGRTEAPDPHGGITAAAVQPDHTIEEGQP